MMFVGYFVVVGYGPKVGLVGLSFLLLNSLWFSQSFPTTNRPVARRGEDQRSRVPVTEMVRVAVAKWDFVEV